MTKIWVNEEHQLELEINGAREVYDLTEPLDEKSGVVVREKQRLAVEMDLASVAANGKMAAKMLMVAYHLRYGWPSKSYLFELLKHLRDLNDREILGEMDYSMSTSRVLMELASMFKWLSKGAVMIAVDKAARMVEEVQEVGHNQQELKQEYEKLLEAVSKGLLDVKMECCEEYKMSDGIRDFLEEVQGKLEDELRQQDEAAAKMYTLEREFISFKPGPGRDSIYDEMIRLEKANAGQLDLFENYLDRLEGMITDLGDEAVILALLLAEISLKRVLSAMNRIAVFWELMEESYHFLAEVFFEKSFGDYREMEKEEIVKHCYSEPVMFLMITYMSRWTAIQEIYNKFLREAKLQREEINRFLMTGGQQSYREEEYYLAESDTDDALDLLRAQIKISHNRIQELEDMKAE